jgi:hypothetical protein
VRQRTRKEMREQLSINYLTESSYNVHVSMNGMLTIYKYNLTKKYEPKDSDSKMLLVQLQFQSMRKFTNAMKLEILPVEILDILNRFIMNNGKKKPQCLFTCPTYTW